jgi:hypothetical protein
MSNGQIHHHGRGPTGTATNNPVPDRGTKALTRHRPAGKQGGEHAAPAAWEIELKKCEYLAMARATSHLMEAKSEGEGALSFAEEELKSAGIGRPGSKPRRVQSVLGGAFLRMYLDGKKDQDAIDKAGVEIGDSPEFHSLSEELRKYLQTSADRGAFKESEPDKILNLADKHLKAINKVRAGGIAFRYTLNAVIGAVAGVDVESIVNYDSATAAGVTTSKYRVNITFSDIYDFENKRTGEYDRFRKELARDLIANDFDKFEATYGREVYHPFDKSMHKTHLDNAAVFASFMYALEKRGWTPGGVSWSVTVPAQITLVFKPVHHAHHGHKG